MRTGTRPHVLSDPPPAAGNPRRGNPNLALAPRCGARTRAGCRCRAPAIRAKLRCRMHGGRSTGPRTEEGLARLRAARTVHGHYSGDARAYDRHVLTLRGRWQVASEAVRHHDRLPPELRARLDRLAPELMPPPWPSGRLRRAEDRAAARAEAAALAPWRLALALAKGPPGGTPAEALPTPQAPEVQLLAGLVSRDGEPEPHAPVARPSPDVRQRLHPADGRVGAVTDRPGRTARLGSCRATAVTAASLPRPPSPPRSAASSVADRRAAPRVTCRGQPRASPGSPAPAADARAISTRPWGRNPVTPRGSRQFRRACAVPWRLAPPGAWPPSPASSPSAAWLPQPRQGSSSAPPSGR
jgi:hypothetical protein